MIALYAFGAAVFESPYQPPNILSTTAVGGRADYGVRPSERHQIAEMVKRIPVAFEGRYMTNAHDEILCRAMEMSPTDVFLHSLVMPAIGQTVVLYLKEVGRFEGTVTRIAPIGFEMTLKLSERKREKLSAQLAWYDSRSAYPSNDRRKHQRVVPLRKLVTVRYSDGEERLARITSISVSGVALATRYTVMPGQEVIVGRKSATVVRVMEDGMACEFVAPLQEHELDENIAI